MDYTTLTDEELEAEFNAVQQEKRRRETLRSTPPQVTRIVDAFLASGGSKQDMYDIINEAGQ